MDTVNKTLQMNTKIKVCGMKKAENISLLSSLNPDYIGFIFYHKSKRYVDDTFDRNNIRKIPQQIKKVGVVVNQATKNVIAMYKSFYLDFVQLHGNESPEFCEALHKENIPVIKAFNIHENFNFEELSSYFPFCEYFLFDTRCKEHGGSGKKFNWEILSAYNNEKPFFLSGGISIDDAEQIKSLQNLNIHAIDINSRFETKPGLKDIDLVGEFIKKIRQ